MEKSNPATWSRRHVIRALGAAGLAVAAGSASVSRADAADSRLGGWRQFNWRWCTRCEGLWFNGHPGYGVCPAGGGHTSKGSGDYGLMVDGGPGQGNWRWCLNCEGLWFNGHPGYGVCPAGGGHTSKGSGDYYLPVDDSSAVNQGDWRWCVRCEGLWFNGHPGYGACPAGGGHTSKGSGDYTLLWQ